VQGVADDNISVRKVEYSTDGGKDWLSVDHTTGLGSTHVTFSFTPLNLEDNTYIFMARAIDGGGNIKATKGITVVIDRLPPAVGGSIIAVGAQVLEPDDKGVITTLSGVDLTVTMSTSGGASSVVVSALDVDHDNHVAASFTLTRDAESGLWNGTLSFSEPGHYQLVAHAVDGANNSDTRTVVTVSVTRPALVLSSKGPVANATATVYYLDPDTDSWIVWDGQAYGQTNPQQTDTNGAFAFMLPAGKYYVHIAAKGYLPLNSMSFVVSQPRPLASAFHLQSRDLLHSILLPVSGFIAAPLTSNLGASNVPASFTKQPMTGKVFPSFVLDDTGGQRQNSVSWLGKPTIVTVMSTWSPTAAEEIAALDTLASNQDINVRVIGMQENIAKLQAYSSISGTELHWLADPNGSLASKLHVGTLPAHYIVDRNGVIQQVINGTESAQQLLDALTEAQ
jgi:peroxiredoxin